VSELAIYREASELARIAMGKDKWRQWCLVEAIVSLVERRARELAKAR